jgi:hypothetical protein
VGGDPSCGCEMLCGWGSVAHPCYAHVSAFDAAVSAFNRWRNRNRPWPCVCACVHVWSGLEGQSMAHIHGPASRTTSGGVLQTLPVGTLQRGSFST